MTTYKISGMTVEIGGFILSKQHRSFDEKHYKTALSHQEARVRRANEEVLAWIAENIPQTVVVLKQLNDIEEYDPADRVAAIFSRRAAEMQRYESFQLQAIFETPRDAVAFKLRWS